MTLLLLAISPVLIVILYIFIQDKYEKEPTRLLVYNFLLGAIVSVIITTLLYVIIDIPLPLKNHNSIYEQFIKAFFVVGLSEEFSKYIIVRYYAQSHDEFNEPFDGIVYAVMVSMGFAATENLMYVLQGGMEVAIIRAFTAIPAHATFAILMGYYIGKAKFSNNRIVLNLTGLFLAVLFHGAYDFFLFIDFVPGIWMGAFISLSIAILLSRKAIKRHQNISYFRPK
ncbi:RsiW-degrading membrane proteinase PrsW (M82 family) [Gelidibacter algens]|uniref:Protease PrsW n=1 Tax=Gelidibacter algens TaxID=49280 RepID=A0A1A7R606_9FLAO|nr:PrsW family glutamic-type intramembrane protease [Gelidibacter algens]OBX26933.1 branched-chain amino acid aminotransferase [Gelidibacter algens]RAJ26485.1 RsiW-degrading membrane proteinase PrsW (M82 family) [Gelidibacter algens]